MEVWLFYIFSFVAVSLVTLMILQINPVASAVCLVGAFFGLAGLYVLLDAHFVAAMQILVYAGAIMVLFVFVIMLLNLKEHELVYDRPNIKRAIVFIIGMGVFGVLTSFFLKIPRMDAQGEAIAFKRVPDDFGTVAEVGRMLFTKYMIPFEVIGILLLVGLVGAVMLGRRED